MSRLLEDRRTTFVVVSTLEAAPVREAEFFINALSGKRFHLGALILNKVLPTYLLDRAATTTAKKLCADAPQIAQSVAAGVGEPDQVARVLRELGESFLNYQVVAAREAEQRAELGAAAEVVVTVPYFDSDIFDLTGLVQLGQRIWSSP